jgi:hypothetical protein
MPDITMCCNDKCSTKDKCYRYRAIPDEYCQSYSKYEGGCDCDSFYPIEEWHRLRPKELLEEKE